MNILFDFSVSNQTGAFQRIKATLEFYDNLNGQFFILNSNLKNKIKTQNNNTIEFFNPQIKHRLMQNTEYIDAFIEKHGQPDIFFSYGIPVIRKIGVVNWFHISNALSLSISNITIPLSLKLKMIFFRKRIKKSIPFLDIVSGESDSTLKLFQQVFRKKNHITKVKLGNGFNIDEFNLLSSIKKDLLEDSYAVAIGIQSYKRIDKAYKIFLDLQKERKNLKKFILIASPFDNLNDKRLVSDKVRKDKSIILIAPSKRQDVIGLLKGAQVFISMSQIENSSNALLEALLFCNELIVSDIPSHREFLSENCNFQEITLPAAKKNLLNARQGINDRSELKSWNECIKLFDSNAKIILENRQKSQL